MIGYLALNAPWRWGDLDDPDAGWRQSPFTLHGFPHPTVFRTLRNAIRAAGPHGHVLILDLHALPRVYFEQLSTLTQGEKKELERRRRQEEERAVDLECKSGMLTDLDIDNMNAEDIYEQHQLAERQMLIWAERCAKLDARVKR